MSWVECLCRGVGPGRGRDAQWRAGIKGKQGLRSCRSNSPPPHLHPLFQTEAQAEMQRLLDAGLTVSPDHYDPLLRMEAARGSLPAARAMLAAVAADPRFAPPTVSSYNALLKGLVSALQPVAAPGEEGVVEGMKGGRVAMSAEEVEVAVTAVKEEMVARGLRPSRWGGVMVAI